MARIILKKLSPILKGISSISVLMAKLNEHAIYKSIYCFVLFSVVYFIKRSKIIIVQKKILQRYLRGYLKKYKRISDNQLNILTLKIGDMSEKMYA